MRYDSNANFCSVLLRGNWLSLQEIFHRDEKRSTKTLTEKMDLCGHKSTQYVSIS